MIESEEQAKSYCRHLAGEQAVVQLEALAGLLAEENERQNLVAGSSLAMLWQRHFADSLQLLPHVSRETGPWLDLGSGAGFPGIAIAIARPDTEVVLVESRKRRVEWLEAAAKALSLENCRIEGARLEEVQSFEAGQICARAFAPLGKLLRLSARFSTRDTTWLLPKGRSAAQELSEQPESIRKMFHVEQSLTDPSAGILIGHGVPRAR